MKFEKRLVLLTLFAMNLVEQPAPEVQLAQGRVAGVVSADGSVLEYIGIPYATTTQENRFKPPLPAPSWEGVYRATREYACPSPMLGVILGEEDCLKANVYVPAHAAGPLPVMVFIHGGAFFFGDGGKMIYGPEFLVSQGVILVTINYRLGVLGFTSLHIPEAPGNAGLHDQLAALRWVRRNIARFGGDADNVTLFGQSAGGVSVSLLIASPASAGLFHRAIVQSGSALANWATDRDPVGTAVLVAREMGYNTTDPQELYNIFVKAPYKDLVRARPKKILDKFMDSELLHLPCVEKTFDGQESVINDVPYNLLTKTKKNIPVIYGSNSAEGLFFIKKSKIIRIQDDFFKNIHTKYIFGTDLKFPSDSEAKEQNTRVMRYYFGGDTIRDEHLPNVTQLVTDLYFGSPAALEAAAALGAAAAPVWLYYYDYSGGRDLFKTFMGNSEETGASHADDLFYLFKARLWPFPINNRDIKMIETMTKLWTNFAKYGEPTPSLVSSPGVRWTASSAARLRFLYLREEPRMGPPPNPAAHTLWRDIYHTYRNTDLRHN